MEGLKITHPDNKNPVVSIPMSGFPFVLWKEWDADCKIHFNDIRWSKAYSDHLKAKLYDELVKNNGVKGERNGKICSISGKNSDYS